VSCSWARVLKREVAIEDARVLMVKCIREVCCEAAEQGTNARLCVCCGLRSAHRCAPEQRRPCHGCLRLSPTLLVPAVRFNRNRWVTGPPHVRFYASAPLVSSDGGLRYGTL
jgi:hypothetical protein